MSVIGKSLKSKVCGLLLFAVPGIAFSDTTMLQLLKRDAKISGAVVMWDIDFDFILSQEDLAEIGRVKKGNTGLLALKTLEFVGKNGLFEGLDDEDIPVVLSCTENMILVTGRGFSSNSCKPFTE